MSESIFKELGLEDTEAKVYNALLELGPSTVTEVTKRARITRTLGYHVLEKLEWHGLVARAGGEGKKMKYAVENPHTLVQFVKEKRKLWDERIAKAEHLLPELISAYNLTDKPIISYQQGVHGVVSAHEAMLSAKTEVLTIISTEAWRETEYWGWAMDEFHKKRIKSNIKERMLLVDAKPDHSYFKQNGRQLKSTQFRFIQPDKTKGLLDLGGEMHIYDNRTMIGILKKPNRMGVIIESAVVANILRAMFNLAWESAQPPSSEELAALQK